MHHLLDGRVFQQPVEWLEVELHHRIDDPGVDGIAHLNEAKGEAVGVAVAVEFEVDGQLPGLGHLW